MKSVQSFHPSKSVIQTSYDIVTKGHGGEIRVVTQPDEGSEFIIQLTSSHWLRKYWNALKTKIPVVSIIIL